MLPAPNRLKKAHEIARVYKRGRYGSATSTFSLKAAPSGRPVTRAVVVVGKKVDKRAVVRNRIRRRLLGALQALWTTVPDGYDIVISVRSDISHQAAAELQTLLAESLRRAHVT